MNTNGLAFIKTHHSLQEGTGRTKEYIREAVSRGIGQLALIDRNSLSDAITFYEGCVKAGIKPIIGVTLSLYDPEQICLKSAFNNPLLHKVVNSVLTAEEAQKFYCSLLSKNKAILKEKTIEKQVERCIDAFIDSLKGRKDSSLNSALRKAKKTAFPFSLPERDLLDHLSEAEQASYKSFTGQLESGELINKAMAHYKPFEDSDFPDLTLITVSKDGFKNIKSLISWAWTEGQNAHYLEKCPRTQRVKSFKEKLLKHNSGVYCVAGLENDILGKAIIDENPAASKHALSFIKDVFNDRLFIGVERSATPETDGQIKFEQSERLNLAALRIAENEKLPAIAINNAIFLDADHIEAHDIKDALLCDVARDNMNRPINFLSGQWLKNWEEIQASFADAPVLISNAEKTSSHMEQAVDQDNLLSIELDRPVLPEFPIPEGFTEESYIRHLAEEGLAYHLSVKYKKELGLKDLSMATLEQERAMAKGKVEYVERLNYEIDIIQRMGFIGYFLIVSDFIQWAKNNGIQVGGGRGSGAGSLTAYCLRITNIDPIEHDLLFERFLNPERVSMPDFDIDFGSGYHPDTGELMTREHVIEYVCEMYNSDDCDFPSVAQIITHGQMLPKSATKAIGKSLGMSLKYREELANEYDDPSNRNMDELLSDPVITARYNSEPNTARLLKLVSATENLKKNTGVHAGGVVIARGDITNFTSIQCPIGDTSKLITQLDKVDVERAGLVKFDFLGLSNLSTIALCLYLVYQNTGKRIDLDSVRMDDEATYELLKKANTHGVFQVESAGMRDLLRRVQVENIEEYSALIALFRPGPLQSGMVDNFIDRKHGREEISYPNEQYQHELLKPILEPTYGIILYQEQVMQIAQVLANYTLGGADLLRRAMGKKNLAEMEKQRATFESGAIANGVDGELAVKIFDLVEKFAGYGFNKSHSMAYAYISYHTAWLKTHYPTEYMAAVLTGQYDEHDDLELTLKDCVKNGIEILPPDINLSRGEFSTEGNLKIRFGLSAIKDVGATSLKAILKERDLNGAFKNAYDMKMRCGAALDTSTLGALVLSGALDSLDTHFRLPVEGIERTLIPEPAYITPVIKSKIRELNADIFEYERRFDSVTGFGIELQKIIKSLCVHYARKYSLDVPESGTLKEKLSVIWKYLSYYSDESQEHEYKDAVVADFEALQRELKGRSNSAEAYSNYLKTLQGKKEQLSKLKNSLSSAAATDANLKLEWESKNKGENFPPHERRRFHLFEAGLLKNVKSTHLKKDEAAIILASLKLYQDDIRARIAEVASGIATLVTENDKRNLLRAIKDKYREQWGNEMLSVTRNTLTKTKALIELASLKKYNNTVAKKLHSDLIQCMLRDQSVLYHFGSQALAKHTPQLTGKDRLSEEMAKLSYYATGHPLDIDNLRSKLRGQGEYCDMKDLSPPEIDPVTKKPLMDKYQRTAGIVTNARPLVVKKEGKLQGRRMMALTLSDGTDDIRVTAFPDTYDKIKDLLFVGSILCISGNVEIDEYLGDGTLKMDIDIVQCPSSGKQLFKAENKFRSGRQKQVERDQKVLGQISKALGADEKEHLISLI